MPLNRFQLGDHTAAYNIHFWTQKRKQQENIYVCVEAWQKLANTAGPYMNTMAHEEMVAYQFLNDLDSHENRRPRLPLPVSGGGNICCEYPTLEAVNEEKTSRG